MPPVTYTDTTRTYHIVFSDGRAITARTPGGPLAALRALARAPQYRYPPVEVLVCTDTGVQKLEGVL